MESLEDSNCHSMSDSFSLYERYIRSFNVVDNLVEENAQREPSEQSSSSNSCDSENSLSHRGVNIDLSSAIKTSLNKHCETAVTDFNTLKLPVSDHIDDKNSDIDIEFSKVSDFSYTSLAASLHENSSATTDHSRLTDKSDPIDAPVSSEESKFECFKFKQPVFITSTMENSNNAVDSVPMFRNTRHTEGVFKLPISELSFNGTIKHVQKLKPMVDPITAFSANTGLGLTDSEDSNSRIDNELISTKQDVLQRMSDEDKSSDASRMEKTSESTGDSQYEEFNPRQVHGSKNESTSKWNLDQSYSSLEGSFDSGVRSPDMFSDEDEIMVAASPAPFWSFMKEFEIHDKKKVRRMEETLQGVLPPPSVTTLKIDVTEMLKKYYTHLPAFNSEAEPPEPDINPKTPTKRVSFIAIPEEPTEEDKDDSKSNSKSLDTSVNVKYFEKMGTEAEAKECAWPDLMKCKYFDVYYNVTKYSEKLELLSLRCGERFVGAETDTSVNIYSGGLQSPSSASKRKALRLKMAQAKSPGRRLSHLARRRQAFCNAATVAEKAHSTAKMVLIDKNFFPHRKLVNSGERKSPRLRRTPGKKTPTRKTPGKTTPAKTPKTRSGGSSRKKAMRRLLMDPEAMTRSQPTRETLKRALFVSPENRKPVPPVASSSVPHVMKSRRALFGSPINPAETKSMDGTESDQFLKRKRDPFDDEDNNRSKIAKSLSFGGDSLNTSRSMAVSRRASEVFTSRNTTEMNETHKKKLLWAVSEALRAHGWRMSAPGFREKAASLARLTRRLLALPPHAARLAAPTLSTSDTMLKIARMYVFGIIQGRSVDECFQEEQTRLANEANSRVTGYISATAYQQLRAKQPAATFTSQIKENTCSDASLKQPRSASKNILQDKLVNIDSNSNSNSSSGLSLIEKPVFYKSNSMPSFEEAAKMRAKRQISFDNVDFPKR